jgi:hypothetical protein
VTTRAGRSTTVFDKQLEKTGILPKPYVTPPLRKNSNEGEIQPRSVKEIEKEIAPKSNTLPVKIGNPPMNNTKEAATSSTILPEAIQMNKVPFPDRFEKSKEDKQFNKFLQIMKDVQVTIPVLDAVLHVPMYAKFFKDLMSKKRSIDAAEVVTLTKECSAVIQNTLPKKLEDPGSFCIPCLIGSRVFNALCDLGSSVSVLPHSVSQMMPLGDLKETNMTLQLADRTYRKPEGILTDILVVVGKFAYPVDFVVLEMEDNAQAIILGRPFLATIGALIDVRGASLTLMFGEEKVVFDMRHSTHIPQGKELCQRIDTIYQCISQEYEGVKEFSTPTSKMIKTNEMQDIVPLYGITKVADENGKEIPKQDVEIQVELKQLPSHLKYYFLNRNGNHPVIVSTDLTEEQVQQLLHVLEKYRKVIGYSIADMIGISPSICTHRIFLEDGCKPTREHQRRLNPTLQDVVKKQILKLLTAKIIYPISDSEWVSPIHVVPKKRRDNSC